MFRMSDDQTVPSSKRQKLTSISPSNVHDIISAIAAIDTPTHMHTDLGDPATQQELREMFLEGLRPDRGLVIK
jgi:hypothetical protein